MNSQILGDVLRRSLPLLVLPLLIAGCDTSGDFSQYKAELQAVPDSFTVSEDKMFSGNVSLNDPLGAGRTYTVGSEPSNGTLNLTSDGSFTYMPGQDYFGSDSFTVDVSYQNGATSSSTVSMTIENVPDTLEEWGWSMIWSDEFDGTSLDAANWTPQLGDGSDLGLDRWGNNELQWYQAENITVEDGNLVVTARAEEVVPGFPYTSGRMHSIDKVDIKYGRIEARVKTPAGQGFWSAFWMLPTDSPYGGWAASGEVDIMEVINAGTPGADSYGTLHFAFPWPLNQFRGKPFDVAAAEEFHTYAIEWEQDEMRWYLDDVHYHTVRSDTWYSYFYGGQDTGYVDGPDRAPFDVDFHILLNLAVGGNLPGTVAPETVFPAQMLVDYVRVYECSADPVSGEGCASWVEESVTPTPPEDVFVNTVDIYTDSIASLSWDVGDQTVTRDLGVSVLWDNGGAILLSEVAAADTSRGTVLDVNTINSGNIGVFAADTEVISLVGFGNNPNWWEVHAGELRFDLYIDSAGTDIDSSLVVKMDSGWPALGFVELKVADLPLDQWTTVSVKVSDLIFNSGDQPLDTNAVVNLFVLEPTGMAHVQLDDVQLVCGHPVSGGCGVKPPADTTPPPAGEPVPGEIYIDAPDPLWALWDCCGGSIPDEIDSGDPEHGNVARYRYLATPTVAGFEAANAVDLSGFTGGTLEFDVYLETPPDDTSGEWFLKMEGPNASPVVEVPLTASIEGVEPTVGAWQHYTFDLDALGFDLSAVKLVMVFPTWGTGNNAAVWLDNVKFVPPVGQVYVNSPASPWSLWDCCGGSIPEEVDSADPAYGNVAQYRYLATPTVAGFEAVPAVDLSSVTGGTLEFDLHLVNPPDDTSGEWFLKMEGPDANPVVEVPLTASIEGVEPTVGAWQHYTFDLDTLGFDLSSVKLVMVFPTWGTGNNANVWLDNVGFVAP